MSKPLLADVLALGASGTAQRAIPLAVDPTLSAGVAAPIGSLGLFSSGGVGKTYIKTGAGNTAWTLLPPGGASIPGLIATTTFAQTGVITPAALTVTTNDYAPVGIGTASRIRQDCAGPVVLTGLLAALTDGEEMIINNLSSVQANTLTLANANVGSAAANRFLLPNGVNWTIPAGGTAVLRYDLTSTSWRLEGVATNIFPSGTVAAPGLIVGTNLQSGLFFDGTNPFLAAGGAKALRWRSFSDISVQGSFTAAAAFQDGGFVDVPGTISPTAFTGVTVNDYAPTSINTVSVIRQDCTLTTSLNGLTGGLAGRSIWLYNISATPGNLINLQNGALGSGVANRFSLPNNSQLSISGGSGVLLTYDGVASKWRVAMSSSITLVSLAITPAGGTAIPFGGATYGTSGSTQMTATGTFSDGSTQDLTLQCAWSIVTGTSATIASTTGIVTYVNAGVVTVKAIANVNPTITANTTLTIGVLTDGPVIGAGLRARVPQFVGDFTALSLVSPNHIWNAQDLSTALVDSVGTANLTANNAPLFAQSLAGAAWNRKGVGPGAAGQSQFINTTYPVNPNAFSVAFLGYFWLEAAPGSTLGFFQLGIPSSPMTGLWTAAPAVEVSTTTVSVGAATNAALAPFLFVYNRLTATAKLYTDAAVVTSAYTASNVAGTQLEIGNTSATRVQGLWSQAYAWEGSSAEAAFGSDAAVRVYLNALGWQVTW